MKAEDIIEYHPNGYKKHKIIFYSNGNKLYEQFYDQQEKYHREQGLPDYQKWHNNGITYYLTYYVHGKRHNIHNPCIIEFGENGKIVVKYYALDNFSGIKLFWINSIKNV